MKTRMSLKETIQMILKKDILELVNWRVKSFFRYLFTLIATAALVLVEFLVIKFVVGISNVSHSIFVEQYLFFIIPFSIIYIALYIMNEIGAWRLKKSR